jgi:hypothetical protein
MARAIQGTATNNTSAQTGFQRDAFGSEGFGMNNTAHELFAIGGAPSPNSIMNRATNRFSLSGHGDIMMGHNPDFPVGITITNLQTFVAGANKFEAVAGTHDKPSIFGPNLSPPDIDELPDDGGPPSQQTIYSATAELANTTSPAVSYKTNGFGTETYVNDPRKGPRSSTWLGRKNAGLQTLGEWINTSKYDYSETSDEDDDDTEESSDE